MNNRFYLNNSTFSKYLRHLHWSLLASICCLALSPAIATAQSEKATKKQDDENLTLDEIFAGKNPKSIDDLRAMQQHVRELSERLKPVTVSLRVNGAQGSGVIISRDGYILTAAHVIGKPNQPVTVIFDDGRTAKAKSLGLNHNYDSGLVKITDEGNWPYVDMGESKPLKRGQWVVSIGHPGGFDKIRGGVVRLGRVIFNNTNVLNTDCTLVGGDSGGPLFDMDGNVIGIHSRIGMNIRQNMHVPVDIFGKEWIKLEKGEEIGRRRSMTPSTSFKDRFGYKLSYRLKVDEVTSEIEKAGLKNGDTIKKFNNTKVDSRLQLRPAGFYKMKKDDEYELTIDRDGKEMKVKLKVLK